MPVDLERTLGARPARKPRLVHVKSSRAWILYSIIRLGIFAIALAALLLLQVVPWVAALIAAVIALCLSYIFLHKLRDGVAHDIYARRHGEAHDLDNEIENAALDELEAQQAKGKSNSAE